MKSPQEERVSKINTYTLHRIIQIVRIDDITIQQTTLRPPNLSTPLFIDQQPPPQSLRVDLQKPRQLLQIHGGVQFQITSHGRREHVRLDLVHEDGQMMLDGVDVDLRIIKVRRGGDDEFRTGGAEKLLEEWQ